MKVYSKTATRLWEPLESMRFTRGIALILLALSGVAAAHACSIPVFRYALERWQAAPYRVEIYYTTALASDERESVQALIRASEAKRALNVYVELIDLAKSEPTKKQRFERLRNQSTPWVAVFMPDEMRIETPVFTGPLNADTIATLTASSARELIAADLLRGATAVWLLVESGNAAEDSAAEKTLRAGLKRAENEIPLPVQGEEDDLLGGPRIHASLPLNVAFTVHRVRRNDPAEALLLRALSIGERDASNAAGPRIYPVFGRARALESLHGENIRAENIFSAAAFLCGGCSCQVEELNPGFDLPMAAAWDGIFENDPPARRETNAKPVQVAIPAGISVATRTDLELPVLETTEPVRGIGGPPLSMVLLWMLCFPLWLTGAAVFVRRAHHV
jgi:hypothetical protein